MRIKNSSNRPRKAIIGGIESNDIMPKVMNFAEITPNLPFTEFDFLNFIAGRSSRVNWEG